MWHVRHPASSCNRLWDLNAIQPPAPAGPSHVAPAMARKPPISSFVGAAHPFVVPKHHTYLLVPYACNFVASRVSNEPMKLSIPAAVPHIMTMESLPYISPISSSIHTKLDRHIRQHRCYPPNPVLRYAPPSRLFLSFSFSSLHLTLIGTLLLSQ